MKRELSSRLHKPTILVLDEDELACTMTTRLLDRVGFDVVSSSDLDEGTSLIDTNNGARGPISMIILDLGKGLAAGYNALKRIRKLAPRIPVLLFTAFTADCVRESGDVRSCPVLEKPYHIQDLLEQVMSGIGIIAGDNVGCPA